MTDATIRLTSPLAAAPARPSSPTDAPQGGSPDLAVDAFMPSNGFPMPNEPVWYDVRISNRGTAAAGPFNIEMRGVGGFFEQRVPNGLPAGASMNLTMGPAWTTFGGSSMSEEVLVDSRNEVPDANRGNNYEWATVMVQQPPVIPIPVPPHAAPAPSPQVLLAE